MGQESEPPVPDQTEQPAEQRQWPEPTDREIDEAVQQDKADQVYADQERHRQLIESTERMLDMVQADEAERQAAQEPTPDPVFDIPPDAQAKIDNDARTFSEAYDRLDEQGMYTHAQIVDKLAKQGIKQPKTAEEIEAAETTSIASHASEMHGPKNSKSKTLRRSTFHGPRDKGAPPHIAREIRGDDN